MSFPVKIAVFARAPVPGACKTRLIPRLGPDGAARLQEKLTTRALQTAVAAGLGPVELWCAPDASHPFFVDCAKRFAVGLCVQPAGDLGARMAHVFAVAEGPALLMGSDCPSITSDDLRACANALQTADAVFLSAEDGGYGLVGLNAPMPPIFENMVWSTPHVFAQTILRLQAARMTWREIRTIWDVDEPADYDRLAKSGLIDF